LGESTYFGGRSLLVNEVDKDGQFYLKDNLNYASKVSVIVSTPKAEIYVINKKSISLLNKELKKTMMKYFKYDKPFDNFDIKGIEFKEKKWRQFKKTLNNEILKESFFKRKS